MTGHIRFEDLERRPLQLANGSLHHRNETLVRPGDPWLLLHASRAVGPWSLAARAGVSIPLGRTEENPFARGRLGVPHQHLQFGTGTFDPLVGAAAGRRLGEWNASVSAHGRLVVHDNRHGYRAGHRFHVSASGDRSVGRSWRGTFGIDLAREEAEEWSGRREEEGNLGRTDLLLSLAVARPVGLGALSFTAKVPLLTRAASAQLDYPIILALGWSR